MQHSQHVETLLRNRGPDHSAVISESTNGKSLLFSATILHHQGSEMCIQPVVERDLVLLFNGDLFMNEIGSEQSDTSYLFHRIKATRGDESELLELLTSLRGPFSVICKIGAKIYFVRDQLGRNSLLFGSSDEMMFLTSVIEPSSEMKVVELPSLGVFVLDLESEKIVLHPYKSIETHEYYQEQFEIVNRVTPVELGRVMPHQSQTDSTKTFNFDFADLVDTQLTDCNLFDHLLNIPAIAEVTNEFINRLTSSVKDRISRVQDRCKNCTTAASCDHSKIGILFSGGVDCTLLAVLTHKLLPEAHSIDLMNVSFEKVTNKQENIDWSVPDRLTGLQTLAELHSLCPTRSWNFVEINIARAQLNESLPKLTSLVYPLSNVLDESLGAALHFASSGFGSIDGKPYHSPCRVLLIGSGADELFGGYTRHRNAFKRSSTCCDLLKQELELDWVRLPSRNLARDDRVIGDHGITVRAPFIEEKFVDFAQKLASTQRCYPKLAEGIGDKLLLRLAAYRLGLVQCCFNRKRALQFGSRIADKRQKATDASSSLKIKAKR